MEFDERGSLYAVVALARITKNRKLEYLEFYEVCTC